MSVNMSIVLVNAGLEALLRLVGDLDFELSEVPNALIATSVVGACSLIGALLIGGKTGAGVGVAIGYQINNLLIPRIRNVGNMLRELATNQLRNLFVLLISGIRNTVSTVLGEEDNETLSITDLLVRYGGNSDVWTNIIETLITFFSGIHGGTFRQITL